MPFTLLLAGLQPSPAQQRTNSWLRATATYRMNERTGLAVELQHRRQNSYDNRNPFSQNLLSSVRPWLQADINPQVRVSFSPLAYYRLNSIIRKKEDLQKNIQEEYRISAALLLQHPLNSRTALSWQTMLEYRMFRRAGRLLRLRLKPGIQYSLHPRWQVYYYEEMLLNVQGAGPLHGFDHNRIAGGVSYRVNARTTADLSYLYISRMPLSTTVLLREHVVHLQLRYRLN